jgi:hypothetical protein
MDGTLSRDSLVGVKNPLEKCHDIFFGNTREER